MLPIIDIDATDPTGLYCYSLKKKLNIKMPSITFDQQLDIKAYEIVRSKKLMDGSGLKHALETVCAPATVGHIFTEKA